MHKLNNNNNMMIIDHDSNSRFLNPSFSSTLLDQIYRSIDQGEARSPEMRFYRDTTTSSKKKQSSKRTETTTLDNKRRDSNKVSEKVVVVGTTEKTGRRRPRDPRDHVDQDVMFFSSASFSSDSCSSSGGFSSSDTESLYGTRSRASCFAPLRPKPLRTSMSLRSEEQGQERQHRSSSIRFNSFRHSSNSELCIPTSDDYDEAEASLIKSKSRALKIYNNLKKVKQPISPGGKITSFLNSIFANSKKISTASTTTTTTTMSTTPTTKSYPSRRRDQVFESDDAIMSHKSSFQASACSSASSFSRSCLSKTNSSEREKLYNGVKRTVRFDCRPSGHKRVCELEDGDKKFPTTTTWNKINGRPPMENMVVEKSKVVEEAAREFLEEYRRNNNNNQKKKNEPITIKLNAKQKDEHHDDDDEVASCASSDLFELDHLAVFDNGRYCEELPVYETTHVGTNRAIAHGLIL